LISQPTLRAALDHVHAKPQARLGAAREIALFPPMTGG
jgi:molybdopterin synthase sulfur carrier subunit